MEKPTKTRSKIFSFLPKTATVSFQNPPFSPGRETHKLKTNARKGFSGPMISIIPARSKSKNGNFDSSEEPKSPKVSCMGQIKHKKKVCILQSKPPKKDKNNNKVLRPSSSSIGVAEEDRKFNSLWSFKKKKKKKIITQYESDENIVPTLNQMKRFQSGRNTLANFDWTSAHIDDHGEKDKDEDEDEVIIAHSAPLMMGGGRIALEPRKEVNLWKRRTMAPPIPLQINNSTT